VAALLAAERFGIEFLRAKDDRFVDDFTLAQVISALLLVLVLALWVRWWRAGKPGAA
jgi:prolipoprotein diacylglyceryltransferase